MSMEKDKSFTDTPVLDDDKLNSIKALADGDDDFFRELTDLFFERAPALLNEMQQALSSKDATQFERSSHALKGSSGNLGAMRMMKVCEEMERIGRENVIEQAEGLMPMLVDLYSATEAQLKKDWL